MIRRILIGLLVVIMVSGCASVPTSGPVERVGPVEGSGREEGINVTAQPPIDGASADVILEGFFSATESPNDSYATARQYLTPEAAADWHPESGITVYDSTVQERIVTSDGAAILRAPIVGRIDALGHYSATRENAFTHNFGLVKVDGQWRISNPGDGVLMSTQRFERSFVSVPVAFLTSGGNRLLYDQVYLPQVSLTVDQVVKAVVNGPSSWLSSVATSALPSEVSITGTYIDQEAIAHVSLSSQVENLRADQRLQAAAQILMSLQAVDVVDGVVIMVDGHPLTVPGANADGVLRISAITDFLNPRDVVVRDSYGVRDGLVVRISDGDSSSASPVSGAFGQDWGDQAGDIAITWAGDRIGVVNLGRDKAYLGASWAEGATVVYQGSGLLRPQFDARGDFWLGESNGGVNALIRVGSDGSLDRTVLDSLNGLNLIAFALSPDGTRIALIVSDGTREYLGMMRVQEAESSAIDGWRRIPLNHQSGEVTRMRDLVFTSEQRLMVLGANDKKTSFSVFSTDLAAAIVNDQGPLTDVDPRRLAALGSATSNALVVLTANGRVLRYEAQFRWRGFGEQFSAIAYPS